MASPGHRITEVRRRAGIDRAVLFVHGFSGDQQDTWGLFPTLIGTDTTLNDWDIVSLGYATSLLPDIRGIWSADPDLPILAIHLNTRFDIAPLAQYRSLAIVAHSMGGLVVQRALLDNPKLVARVKHLVAVRNPERRPAESRPARFPEATAEKHDRRRRLRYDPSPGMGGTV